MKYMCTYIQMGKTLKWRRNDVKHLINCFCFDKPVFSIEALFVSTFMTQSSWEQINTLLPSMYVLKDHVLMCIKIKPLV